MSPRPRLCDVFNHALRQSATRIATHWRTLADGPQQIDRRRARLDQPSAQGQRLLGLIERLLGGRVAPHDVSSFGRRLLLGGGQFRVGELQLQKADDQPLDQ